MFELYWEYYVMGIILLPAIILAIYAQCKVTSTYKKYSNELSQKGMKSQDLARLLLDCADLQEIQVIRVNGELTDYYDHKHKTVALSSSTYNSSSISALGVTAHEVGHALQYKNNYLPIKLRSIIIPIVNIWSNLLWPLVILGIILNFAVLPTSAAGKVLMWIGIGFYGLIALLDVITLPVEYNASHRAIKILEQSEILDKEETNKARKVLGAAALTYVASLLNSLLNLLRFILVFVMHSKKDD